MNPNQKNQSKYKEEVFNVATAVNNSQRYIAIIQVNTGFDSYYLEKVIQTSKEIKESKTSDYKNDHSVEIRVIVRNCYDLLSRSEVLRDYFKPFSGAINAPNGCWPFKIKKKIEIFLFFCKFSPFFPIFFSYFALFDSMLHLFKTPCPHVLEYVLVMYSSYLSRFTPL